MIEVIYTGCTLKTLVVPIGPARVNDKTQLDISTVLLLRDRAMSLGAAG